MALRVATAAEPHVFNANDTRSSSPRANASAVDADINDHFGGIFRGES